MEGTEDHIVIVGAGVAGLATAIGLHRLGIRSLVLESSDKLRTTGFALGIWQNGWKALDALCIGDSLRRDHPLIQTEEMELRCVERKNLLQTLANKLPDGTIRYSSKVVAIDESGHLKIVHLADGSVLRAKVLIGCDGVNSAVARWLGFKKPSFTSRAAVRGYLDYKQRHGFEFKVTHFLGKGSRFGIVPSNDTSVYWFFCWTPSPQEKEMENDPVKVKQCVLSRLGNVPDQVQELFERTELDNLWMSSMRYRHPWELAWGNICKGNVCVAGDAFHPMTADLAQGGCAALEDGVVLARCLGQALQNNHDNGKPNIGSERERIEMGLKNYANERRWRGIKFITAGLLVGYIQEGAGTLLSFFRDRVLSAYIVTGITYVARFDCGNLSSA